MKAQVIVALIAMFACTALADNVVALPEDKAIDLNAKAFDVCGRYCGPGWCANEYISEQSCVAEGVWGIPSDGSCADSCCRIHDYCCGEGTNRPACNSAIVSCLSASSCYLTLCGAVVWAAMKAVSTWCCGSACPTAMMQAIEASLSATTLQQLNATIMAAIEQFK